MAKLDFSYRSYGAILELLDSCGYRSRDYLSGFDAGKEVILRHDIDIDIFGCERMAEIELEHSMYSTWFFQPNNDYYNPLSHQCLRILRSLSEKHILGLHIDPALFSDNAGIEQSILRIYEFYSGYLNISKVFSAHRPFRFFDDPGFRIDGFANAYAPEFMGNAVYVSDSNRRPFFEQERFPNALENGDDLILLTHPLWWKEQNLEREELLENLLLQTDSRIFKHALRENITMFAELDQPGKGEIK